MRRIELDGAANVRDLGGIENIYGKKVKEKSFIRMEHLNKLSDRDIQILVNEYNLKTVIDLRTDDEVQEVPDRKIDNVKYFHIPIFASETLGITREMSNDYTKLKSVPDMEELYKKMVTDEFSVLQLKKIMEIILEENASILFHCTAGKDRTGIIAMLVLTMLDASKDEIMKDYLESNYFAKSRSEIEYKENIAKTNDKEFSERIRKVCIADEKYLNSAINVIEENYESLKGFIINKLEISEKTMDNFKEKYLVD